MVLGKFGGLAKIANHILPGTLVQLSEGMPMLVPYREPEIPRDDLKLFDTLVPFDHWTRRADKYVDFRALRGTLEPLFAESGRPAIEPVLFLKFELLMFHDGLSDSQVFFRAETDLAYRRFLGLGRHDHLPDVSTLRKFRHRLGAEGHGNVFHALLEQARKYGLVKDRLRLKDATHVLADIAIPAGLQMVAQARNKLLNAAEPFEPEQVSGERVRLEAIRESTNGGDNEARLLARVAHLRDILSWVEQLPAPPDAAVDPAWDRLRSAIDIARRVLVGQDDPNSPGKIRSTVDPDARRGRHGEYYDGYCVDVLVDADSELFTAINVIPAGGSESDDALVLLEQERAAHHNDIEMLSIDGAGYDGAVIRALESPEGFNTKVFVPAKDQGNGGKFTSDEFELSEDGSFVTCPANEQSQYKQREESRHTTAFRFPKATCQACPLMNSCIDPKQKHGRTVKKSDYEPEYTRVRERAASEEYKAVKREHPKVERRIGELINRHGGRRARYRGLGRVLVQALLGAMTANLNRMLRLLDARPELG
jgi:IS5 family transposase